VGFEHGSPFGSPFFLGGAGTSSLVTAKVFDVALGGRPYMIDWSAEVPLRHQSITLIRDQADQSESPGEQSINPEGFWRRFGESWHLGAGQLQFDREESSHFMFNTSKGINIWERWELTLLPTTEQVEPATDTNLFLAVAGTRLYFTEGNVLKFYTDVITPGSATTVTGTPATNPTSIATDGFVTWTAHGTDGLYKTDRGISTAAQRIIGTINRVGVGRGRVIVFGGLSVYDVTTQAYAGGVASVLPAALFTHSNPDWLWTSIAESSSHIYIAGYAGDKSYIYSISIQDDGVTLNAPVTVANFEGEIVQSLFGYLGQFLLIGTDRGWRFAVTNPDGTLAIGSLTETPLPVLAFEGQQEFIWFGYGNFDATSTGLGRLSTAFFSDDENLVPAYASDLMVDGQTANIQSVVTFQNIRVFTVSGVGLYRESDELVDSGTLDTGLISYGMTEPKTGIWLTSTQDQHHGEVELYIRAIDGEFTLVGTHHGEEGHTTFTVGLGELSTAAFEIRIRLIKDDIMDLGHRFLSWLLRVQPRSEPSMFIFATLLMADEIETNEGTAQYYDTHEEYEHILNLWQTRAITSWQQPQRAWSVFIDDFDIDVKELLSGRDGHEGYNSSILVKMKVVV
jgi:hypothetical protein